MKKKKSEKPKTELTRKPENGDGEFDDVMKALLSVPKKSKAKKETAVKGNND
ncbi:MAG: hypothetical protein IIA63_05965 [Nitrospinae bacterium]|nr:hypothetical protein [Nitrospinota bacterium]